MLPYLGRGPTLVDAKQRQLCHPSLGPLEDMRSMVVLLARFLVVVGSVLR